MCPPSFFLVSGLLSTDCQWEPFVHSCVPSHKHASVLVLFGLASPVCSQNQSPGCMTLLCLGWNFQWLGITCLSVFRTQALGIWLCHGWHFYWLSITCQSVFLTQALDVWFCHGSTFSLVWHHLSVCSQNPSHGCITLHWAFSLAQTYLSVCDQNPSPGYMTCHGWHFCWLSITCQSVLRTQALMYDFVAAGTFAGSESPVCSQNPSPGCMTLLWLALLLAQNHLSVLRTQALDV